MYENYNLLFGNTISKTGTINGGANDVFSSPAFVGSAAIDTGTDVGVTNDFDGDIRKIGPGFDIGFAEALIRLFLPLIRR